MLRCPSIFSRVSQGTNSKAFGIDKATGQLVGCTLGLLFKSQDIEYLAMACLSSLTPSYLPPLLCPTTCSGFKYHCIKPGQNGNDCNASVIVWVIWVTGFVIPFTNRDQA